MIKQTFMNIHGKILHQILTLDGSYSSEILAILFHSKGENETVNDNVSLFSTRTCLFTAANDRSHKCFHRYVQRDINSSHLLHKSTLSGGQSKGHREHGDIGDTYCTLSSNTPVLPPTEKGQRHGEGDREKGGREEGKERRGGHLDLYSNTKEHVQIV